MLLGCPITNSLLAVTHTYMYTCVHVTRYVSLWNVAKWNDRRKQQEEESKYTIMLTMYGIYGSARILG